MSDLTFTPRSDEEINALNLLEPGECDYEVVKAESKLSQASGNKMIELVLKVWDVKGREKYVYDYLVNTPRMEYKIKHFCESANLMEDYISGSLSAIKCTGRCGKLKLIISKDKSGEHKDKNSVQDYIKLSEKEKVEFEKTKPFVDDDIPF